MSRPSGGLGYQLPRVVPWSTWAEWVDVYHWLYSGDPESRAMGVSRVRVWVSRGKVPLSVESTANLVEITLHDRFPSERSTNELRLLYSMAIIRFVNGLVEAEQGATAKSVALIAQTLGLPRVLVDLRHAATHKILPSLPTLRQGCVAALTYLNQTYWSRQERQLLDVKTVVHYRLNRYEELYGVPDAKVQSLVKCIKKIIEKTNVNHVTAVVIPYLLDHIIPETPRPVHQIIECWIEPITLFTAEWPHFLPSLLISLVDQLAKEVHKAQARQERLKPEERVASPKVFYIAVIAKWLKYFLKTPRMVSALQSSFIEMPFTSLLETLLSMPHKSARNVAKKLLPLVHLKKGFRAKLKLIMQLHPEQVSKDSKKRKRTEDSEVLDMETLRKSFEAHKAMKANENGDQHRTTQQRKRAKAAAQAELEANGWALCSEWKACPLGMLENSKLPDLSLPKDFDKMCGARFLVPRVEQQPIEQQTADGMETQQAEEEEVALDWMNKAESASVDNNWKIPALRKKDKREVAKGSVQLLFSTEDLLSL